MYIESLNNFQQNIHPYNQKVIKEEKLNWKNNRRNADYYNLITHDLISGWNCAPVFYDIIIIISNGKISTLIYKTRIYIPSEFI